jgi:S-layer family protein
MTKFAMTRWTVLAAAAFTTGCAAVPDAPSTATGVAALGSDITYHSGPMILNVKITPVLWGGNVDPVTVSSIAPFYTALTGSQFVQKLSEYSEPNQTIGFGSLAGTVRITPAPANSGSMLSSGMVGAELGSQIEAGVLPRPDDNTLYAVHFPRGTILDGVPGGCGAEHAEATQTIFGTRVTLHYAEIIDFDHGVCCSGACGSNTPLQNLTAQAAHEVAEAVTDPQPATAAAWEDPLAIDNEIADVCRTSFGTIEGPDGAPFTVQLYLSKAAGGQCGPCALATCSTSGGCAAGSGCTLRGQHPVWSDAASGFDSDAAGHGWIAPCAGDASSASFCPGSTITRGELAAVVVRALFGDTFSYSPVPYFMDVQPTDWRFPYIQKLRDLGITRGANAKMYLPNDNATRRDAAVFMTRAYAYRNFGGIDNFTACPNPFFSDVPPSDVAYSYIQEFRSLGMTAGTGVGTYSPDLAASRENTAVFIERAFDPAHVNDRVPTGCP